MKFTYGGNTFTKQYNYIDTIKKPETEEYAKPFCMTSRRLYKWLYL